MQQYSYDFVWYYRFQRIIYHLHMKKKCQFKAVVPKLWVMTPKGVKSLCVGVMEDPAVCTISSLKYMIKSNLDNKH